MRRLPFPPILLDSFMRCSSDKSQTRLRVFTRRFASAFIILFTASLACGQITNVNDTTSTPIPGAGHDYIKMLNETVNPANGSLSMRIQVPEPKGRGLTLPFSFNYDSNSVNILRATGYGSATWTPLPSFLSQGGWGYSVPIANFTGGTRSYNSYNCKYWTDYMFQDPTGGQHARYWLRSAGRGLSSCPKLSN
jgi:hypothetical protein